MSVLGAPAPAPAASAGSRSRQSRLVLVECADGDSEVNLDYAATTPALQATLDAVNDFIPHYGSVHRGGGRRSAYSTEAFEDARSAVAQFVGCPPAGSVIFVRNTTEAANVLAAALPVGSRVLCAPFEHHANLLPWRRHELDHLPFTRSSDELLEAVASALQRGRATGKAYDLLAISGASNVTGEITPLAELSSLAHEAGARIFVDAAQLAPHRPIDLDATGADFLAFSGHKVYAPFGSGALISAGKTLGDGLPLLRGGGAVKYVSLAGVAWDDVPHRYEAGTPNTIGAIALGAACRVLTAEMEHVVYEEKRLAERLWRGIEAIEGVTLLQMWPEVADRVGVATFLIDGLDPRAVSGELASRFGIAVRSGAFCAHPLVAHLLGVAKPEVERLLRSAAAGGEVRVPGAVRASIGIGVTDADVDLLLTALEVIAQER